MKLPSEPGPDTGPILSIGPRLMEPRRKQVLTWAQIDETPEEGLILVYRTSKDMNLRAATRKIYRKPYFFPGGFAVEIEENGWRAMLRFTEYHGKRGSWDNGDGSAFRQTDETSRCKLSPPGFTGDSIP